MVYTIACFKVFNWIIKKKYQLKNYKSTWDRSNKKFYLKLKVCTKVK